LFLSLSTEGWESDPLNDASSEERLRKKRPEVPPFHLRGQADTVASLFWNRRTAGCDGIPLREGHFRRKEGTADNPLEKRARLSGML